MKIFFERKRQENKIWVIEAVAASGIFFKRVIKKLKLNFFLVKIELEVIYQKKKKKKQE